ncbi:flagellar hook-associated protein 1 FlgK [Plasticicumulans lactativorans]|uniref:Flagellar hook-associated protein 1 n=1 Tax=Plasticicumulans lactativorans TaxID=1133106 RepID=A0A4R2KZG2_9GAMM|nr:flagellar hook-associated protein FlgK [Plasticicumulans lactativorans]TCO76839.1 flagellar hook-associated protein 1 FlgK [Plasticicumulans lactativorans]
MVDILRTAISGLRTAQQGLSTAGHNIANVNTPNYSRQRIEQVAARPEFSGKGTFLGTGVDVQSVKRVYDNFLTQQVRVHSSTLSQLDVQDGLYHQVNGLLADSSAGFAPMLQAFFDATQAATESPTSTPLRQVMLSQAQALASRVRDLDGQFAALRDNVNTSLKDTITEINGIAEAIGKVNRDIVVVSGGGAGVPNDLLDKRDDLLAQLAERVNVQAVEQADGTVNVFVGSGQPVAIGFNAYKLETARSSYATEDLEIRFAGQAQGTDLSSLLQGGKLGGLLAFRNETLNGLQSDLGLLARGISDTFNAQHREGMDLENRLGQDFFKAGDARVLRNDNNSGGASLSATVTDATALARSDYEITSVGGAWQVRRLSDNHILGPGEISVGTGTLDFDGVHVDIAGTAPANGDRFLLQPTREAARTFDVAITRPVDIALATPIRASAIVGNAGSGTISSGTVLDAADPHLLDRIEVRFTSATSYDVVDVSGASEVTLSSGNAYDPLSGATLALNGWQVALSGEPAAGDVFRVENNQGGIGDNRNGLLLAGLATQRLLLDGTYDYKSLYGDILGGVGSRSNRVANALDTQTALLDQARQARDAASGVNLDEEAADLQKFQQSYSASAQLIRVADNLFQTLLGVVQR